MDHKAHPSNHPSRVPHLPILPLRILRFMIRLLLILAVRRGRSRYNHDGESEFLVLLESFLWFSIDGLMNLIFFGIINVIFNQEEVADKESSKEGKVGTDREWRIEDFDLKIWKWKIKEAKKIQTWDIAGRGKEDYMDQWFLQNQLFPHENYLKHIKRKKSSWKGKLYLKSGKLG